MIRVKMILVQFERYASLSQTSLFFLFFYSVRYTPVLLRAKVPNILNINLNKIKLQTNNKQTSNK